MIAEKLIKITGVSLLAVGLTSCTGSNIKGEWDCPKPEGRGCIDIRTADIDAVARIPKHEKPKALVSNVDSGKKMKVWIAPHEDEHGNKHGESVLYYNNQEVKNGNGN